MGHARLCKITLVLFYWFGPMGRDLGMGSKMGNQPKTTVYYVSNSHFKWSPTANDG